MQEPDRVIDLVVEKVRPAVLAAGFSLDSCIVTTRVTLDIFQYFGIQGKPVPVEVIVANGEASEIAEREGMATLAEVVHRHAPETPGGPWTLGLGLDDGTGGAGHVIAYVKSKSLLLDLSLDQASRPVKNMILPPSVFHVNDPEWVKTSNSTPLSYLVNQSEGGDVLIIYRHAKRHRYRESPNWARVTSGDATAIPALTANLIRDIRGSL